MDRVSTSPLSRRQRRPKPQVVFDAARPLALRRYLRHGMLPQLAAFEAVVRLGSAARAAEALCIAPPTLSGHLRKLSEALDVRLFGLHGKRLVPTDAALVLLQAVHEVNEALERCEGTLMLWRGRNPVTTEPVREQPTRA
jgi:hypothetical protein